MARRPMTDPSWAKNGGTTLSQPTAPSSGSCQRLDRFHERTWTAAPRPGCPGGGEGGVGPGEIGGGAARAGPRLAQGVVGQGMLGQRIAWPRLERASWWAVDLAEVRHGPAGRLGPRGCEQPQHGDVDAVVTAGTVHDAGDLLPPRGRHGKWREGTEDLAAGAEHEPHRPPLHRRDATTSRTPILTSDVMDAGRHPTRVGVMTDDTDDHDPRPRRHGGDDAVRAGLGLELIAAAADRGDRPAGLATGAVHDVRGPARRRDDGAWRTASGRCAPCSTCPPGATTSTIESKTNFFRGVREGAVHSTSRPVARRAHDDRRADRPRRRPGQAGRPGHPDPGRPDPAPA